MTLENTSKLAEDILQKRQEHLKSKIVRYPAKNFWASGITDCDRQMIYNVLNWEDKSLHNEYVQALFDRGNVEERTVNRELNELGFELINQQNPMQIKNKQGEVICTGRIDWNILYNKESIPCEIKSTNINNFNAIKDLESLKKRPYMKRYIYQMQLYLFGNNKEAGLLIFTDLQGHYKILIVTLDFGLCEWILQKLERNWEHVKAKTYPDRIDYDEKICGKCNYKHICLQEIKNVGAKIIDNALLEEKLERREELKEMVEEYENLDDEIKQPFKDHNIEQAFVGTNWQISLSVQKGSRVDTKALPADIKEKYSVPTEKKVVKIVKL